MGGSDARKYGLLQDLLLIVVSVSYLYPCTQRQPAAILLHANVLSLQSFSMYYIAKSVIGSLPTGGDQEKESHEQARVKAAANLRRLDRSRKDAVSDGDSEEGSRGSSGRPRAEDLVLDNYESQIAMEVVAPEDIPVGFNGTDS